MTIPARLQISPAGDQRTSTRRKLRLGSSLRNRGEEVTIHDVSSSGMLIETGAELTPFDGLEIELPQVGITQAVVVWSSGRFYGCQFKERISQAAVSAALLRSPPTVQNDLARAPLQSPAGTPAFSAQSPEEPEAYSDSDEEKAPYGVRLRVILGSAVVLWALIIWSAWWLIKLIREN